MKLLTMALRSRERLCSNKVAKRELMNEGPHQPGMAQLLRDTHIIIPTYNEVENIVPLIEDIVRRYEWPEANIWVMDDNSPDGTGETVRSLAKSYPNVRAVIRCADRGYGRASAEGMRAAIDAGARFVLTMDADFSHSPETIGSLLGAAGTADLVIGSRYVFQERATVEDWSWPRLFLSRMANQYVRLMTRVVVRDATSGFRCWRAEMLGRVLGQTHAAGYAFLPETLYHAGMLGARITEVANSYHGRIRGESKMNWRIVLESLWIPLRLRFSR
jgi:dolichol-phosphate mannosyltransferase